MPLQERIEIVVERNAQLNVMKRELKQLFDFAASGTHFIFNGGFYERN